MPAGDFFGGFAKALSQGLVKEQEAREAEAQRQRGMQIELLQQQANRADLRPELRPVIMDNLIKLAGMDNKGKKKAEFDTALKTLMGLMTGPQEITTTENKVTGELPSAANTTTTPIVGLPAGIPGTESYGQQTGAFIPDAPATANQRPTQVVQSQQVTRTVPSAFLSPEELQARGLRQREEEAKIAARYRPDAKVFQPLGSIITRDGKNYQTVFDTTTGEQKVIPLAEGTPLGVQVAQTRASGQKTLLKTLAPALKAEVQNLAAEAGEEDVTDDEVLRKYLGQAAENLKQRNAEQSAVRKSTTQRNIAAAKGTIANLPTDAQPNVPEQRQFEQVTKQIGEIDKERAELTQPRSGGKFIGKKLSNGKEITPEDRKDTANFLKLKAQYLRELDERRQELINQRLGKKPQGKKGADSTVPRRGGAPIPDIGQRQKMTLPMGQTKNVGETFQLGPHTFRVEAIDKNGTIDAVRIK